MQLSKKKCVPCEGNIQALTALAAQNLLKQLTDWQIADGKLTRNFRFKNFRAAIRFINKIAAIAENENHHPNIYLYGWNKVKLTLFTHAIKGLHQNDFILAAKIDRLI